ncbi:GNAT family N-acetyltransferase [Crenobacter sp. SG2303]|uniref:GNAT family N-acetyltransferase n=1 Tax=Crenobacter oryzisoli TaxID=3056844 RepID=A0ABT7XTR1_9NEIS|nr:MULTISPECIES: GNAT family N-acetyltransferase [unclassified Crenobacter]MDN0077191.1 GNAT family N-acetyltransferase [Crenobacter sp. SG2303]MDN0083665.1 GNAT family N-acetyltransferase [Crenobacter sp. SG2305]
MTIEFSTDPARLDLDAIHRFLSEEAYWSRGLPREVLERAIAGSLCAAAYQDGRLVGFARAVTDRATFAYLADVFMLPEARGLGIGKRLVAFLLDQPELQGLRRMLLVTADAHSLYARFGFTELAAPERVMERHDPEVYRRKM